MGVSRFQWFRWRMLPSSHLIFFATFFLHQIIIEIFNPFCEKRFKEDNFNSTSMFSTDIPSSSWFVMEELCHFLNLRFMYAFAEPLMIRSSGWNRFVMLAGTLTNLILFFRNFWITRSVIWPLKALMINKAGWLNARWSMLRSFLLWGVKEHIT